MEIYIKEDRIGNFVTVTHTPSGDKFRLHQDDVPKLGTPTKVAAYAQPLLDYVPPCQEYPKGLYRAKVRYFIGTGLTVNQ